jgi:hypothetical protein
MAGQDRSNSSDLKVTRRSALVGSAAGGALVLASAACAQSGGGLIRSYARPRQIHSVDHAVVYRREDEFNGWPHIRGFWNLGGGELVQNFNSVPHVYSTVEAISHNRLYNAEGRKMVTIRSRDYGRTWDSAGAVFNAYERRAPGTENAATLADLGPIDYFDPAVLLSNSSVDFAHPEARTFVRISRDRGRSWSPDLPLPLDGLHSLSGLNSSLVRPDGTVLLFLFEVGPSGFDRHPLVYALPPRGEDFHFLSFVTPKTDPYGAADGDYSGTLRFGGHRWFYPRGYLLANGRMLCVLRCQRDPRGDMWTEVFASDDGGLTWEFLSRVNDFGAPGSLVVKRDGRLVMVYGYRLMPSGIRAKVSEDGGATWGPELIVRDDGGSWDLGYPNAWETEDGKVGVIYYFNSGAERVNVDGGVRHIARSIFSVDD